MLNAIIYAYPDRDGSPGNLLAHANRHLFAKRLEGTFVTAFLAMYDPADRTLTYARAGHNPPLLKDAGPGGRIVRLDSVGGVPLGIMDEVEFEDGKIQLRPGQTLVMYTDGIPESLSPQREMFGLAGIEQPLYQCSGEPACVVNSITTALKAHEAGLRPGDDQTIVAVRVD